MCVLLLHVWFDTGCVLTVCADRPVRVRVIVLSHVWTLSRVCGGSRPYSRRLGLLRL